MLLRHVALVSETKRTTPSEVSDMPVRRVYER